MVFQRLLGINYHIIHTALALSAIIVSLLVPTDRGTLVAMYNPILKASFCIIGSRISINLREAMVDLIQDDNYEADMDTYDCKFGTTSEAKSRGC